MSNAAAKLDPLDLAFENAPALELPEEQRSIIEEAVRESRAELASGGALVPHHEAMRQARERLGVKR